MSTAPAHLEDLLVGAVMERLRPELDALRAEVERLRAANDSAVTIPEAARRLGRTVRHVQRCLKDGRLAEAPAVGGVRMVQWVAGIRPALPAPISTPVNDSTTPLRVPDQIAEAVPESQPVVSVRAFERDASGRWDRPLPKWWANPSLPRVGIYFLCDGDAVMYVGQSYGIGKRLRSHAGTRYFTAVFAIACPEEHLDEAERRLIEILKPAWNVAHARYKRYDSP